VRVLSELDALLRALPALFAPVAGEPVIGLAVSGGADSLALMLVTAQWARTREHPPHLVIYSVDHGLRPEAEAEVRFVIAEAQRLGLLARGLRWEGDKPTSGVQAAAREARYRLIGEAMRDDGASVLLTAHHRDDQAETVLMRMAHGSGLEGLRGMEALAEVEGVRVFRPLLGVPRDILGAIVADAGLTPVADPSNDDRHYERVRWRQALPQLAALGLGADRLVQLAQRAGEADAAIGQWAVTSLADLLTVDAFGAARLPAVGLKKLPRAVGVKLLAHLLDSTGGGQRPRALGVVERLRDDLVLDAPVKGLTLLGVAIRRRGGDIWFSRELGRHPAPPVAIEPEASLVWDGRFNIANRSRSAVIEVAMAGRMSRARAEGLLGEKLTSPIEAIRSAPLITAEGGGVLAIGAHRLSGEVAVTLA
jgi:tRNA(Ile)-lysidine synthase